MRTHIIFFVYSYIVSMCVSKLHEICDMKVNEIELKHYFVIFLLVTEEAKNNEFNTRKKGCF